MRIVLGNGSLARYPQGGGHWAVRLQCLLGLKALGHEVFLLELFWLTGDANHDHHLIRTFFERLRSYGLHEQCAVLAFSNGVTEQNLNAAESYGRSLQEIKDIIATADMLWNDCCGVRQPLLGKFRRRVLIDMDP